MVSIKREERPRGPLPQPKPSLPDAVEHGVQGLQDVVNTINALTDAL